MWPVIYGVFMCIFLRVCWLWRDFCNHEFPISPSSPLSLCWRWHRCPDRGHQPGVAPVLQVHQEGCWPVTAKCEVKSQEGKPEGGKKESELMTAALSKKNHRIVCVGGALKDYLVLTPSSQARNLPLGWTWQQRGKIPSQERNLCLWTQSPPSQRWGRLVLEGDGKVTGTKERGRQSKLSSKYREFRDSGGWVNLWDIHIDNRQMNQEGNMEGRS